MKNKDLYDTLEEARNEYWKQRIGQNLFITFETWLFRELETEEAPAEEVCNNCRFYLSLAGIPFVGMQGRCLLNFGVPSGKCEKYEPEGKQTPSCYSCTHSLTGGENDCLCTKGWTHKDDGENCDEWEERR